ncbi:hypothetical protein PROFUN_01496 [Planoprotostelium fungivorum]|uniref:Uncharacterized protein n=1 Tax=Planoprotostelium fungivorum TaxID=1890364 RepID=A0A2P6NTF2_9EUKA|nr:hypothetical protein PROFUN_15225 [Planoprotostelium fungivorum]PRP87234.1 hypothetical protein PROFUN_01496 [Planoprotostelium fungivorum]
MPQRPGFDPDEDTGLIHPDPVEWFNKLPLEDIYKQRDERDKEHGPLIPHPIDQHRKGFAFEKLSDKELWRYGTIQDNHVVPNPDWEPDYYRPMLPTAFGRNVADPSHAMGTVSSRGTLPAFYGRKQVFFNGLEPDPMHRQRPRGLMKRFVDKLARVMFLGFFVGFAKGYWEGKQQIKSVPGWQVRIHQDARLRFDILKKRSFLRARRTTWLWGQWCADLGMTLIHYVVHRSTGYEHTSALPITMGITGAIVGSKHGMVGIIKNASFFAGFGLLGAVVMNAQRDHRGLSYIILNNPYFQALDNLRVSLCFLRLLTLNTEDDHETE